jgi:cephalosporin hydroxylase
MSSFARAFLRRILPLSDPRFISVRRRIEDLRSLPVVLNPAKRRRLRHEFQGCANFTDYFNFAGRALHGGALQEPEEISAAIDYIRLQEPRCICEIGTANGGTNFLLTHLLESVKTIIGVDLYITNAPLLRLLLRPDQQLQLINGSSYSSTTAQRVETVLDGTSIDLLFIDGDHRYEGVKRDFLLYSRLVREGGLIMFHDIVPDHFSRYGRPGPRRAGDVPRFWNLLSPHYRHREFVRDPEQDGLGLGLLHWSSATPLPQL